MLKTGGQPVDRVSVILPYYNRSDVLTRAIDSVLRQTHRDLILYLINDGSTDRSRDVAHGIEDPRLRHVDNSTNGGACRARNLGLVCAATTLVAFMDSDDEWMPQKLELQVAYLRHRQRQGEPLAVVGCGWRYSSAEGGSRSFAAGPFTFVDVLRGVKGMGTPMLLVDRSFALPDAQFDPMFPSLEEGDYVLTCLSNDSLLRVVSEELVVVHRGRKDHVANPSASAMAWELYLSKYRDEIRADPIVWSWYHFRAGREHLVARDRRASLPHLRAAVRHRGTRRSVHLFLGLVAGYWGLALAQRLLPL